MGHTYVAVYGHIIFSTKNRVKWLLPELRPRIFGYLAAAFREQGCPALEVGGEIEHIHALVQMDANVRIRELVKEVKRTSSIWVKTLAPNLDKFGWQTVYGAFSVSYSNIGRV